MVAAIYVLSALLIAAVAFIFWLCQVLKNTFGVTESLIDLLKNKTPRKLKEAYDGVYYPATVIAQIEFNAQSEMVITDFSLYDEKQIVGFTIYTPESIEQYYGVNVIDSVTEDFLHKPTVFKDVLVYAPQEGVWTWKSRT